MIRAIVSLCVLVQLTYAQVTRVTVLVTLHQTLIVCRMSARLHCRQRHSRHDVLSSPMTLHTSSSWHHNNNSSLTCLSTGPDLCHRPASRRRHVSVIYERKTRNASSEAQHQQALLNQQLRQQQLLQQQLQQQNNPLVGFAPGSQVPSSNFGSFGTLPQGVDPAQVCSRVN